MPLLSIRRPALFRAGDVNAFFGLTVDNLTQMVIMASILTGVFGLPLDVVLYRMIPGSVVGVMIGNLVYTWLAFRLAAKTGRTDVTAMPLGIDTPSLFAYTFGIIGPAFLATHDAVLTWRIAAAVIVTVGVVKICGAFIGDALRRVIPRAGLLGPIAGVAILLIAFFPALKVMHDPIPGLLSLGIILVCLVGRYRFPGGVPAALAAVVAGVGVYYALQALGVNAPAGALLAAPNEWRVAVPWPTLGFLDGLPSLPTYLPIALPFALAVIIGGVDVTESAAASGDEYSARTIVLTDGVSTVIGGLCGAVVQTRPVWQLTQRSALDMAGAVAPWLTCARCAPTWLPVAAPVESAGGAALARLAPRASRSVAVATGVRLVSPWQEVQVWATTSSRPLRWSVALAVVPS